MKINEVISREADYGDNPKMRQLASLGRTLMDISAKMPMKGLSDDEIAKSNRMSAFGDALTRMGTPFGPKNAKQLLDLAGVDAQEAQEFMELAKKKGPVKSNVPDPEPEDEPEDDMDGPDDDEIARQADRMARGK